MRSLLKSVAVLGVAVASLVPSGAHASPMGGVHEGAGYAVAVGPGPQTTACTSTAQFIPADEVTIDTAPVGVRASAIARATSVCVGTLPVSHGLLVEAWNTAGTKYLSTSCGTVTTGIRTCDLVIPAGWGTFYIMPSAFWDVRDDAAWPVLNPANNDGYCNVNSGADPSSVVCRAWATGIS